MRLRFDSPSFVSHHSFSRSSKNRTEKLVLVLRVRKKKKNGNGEKKNGSSKRERAREGNVIGEGIGSRIGGGGRVDTRERRKRYANSFETFPL